MHERFEGDNGLFDTVPRPAKNDDLLAFIALLHRGAADAQVAEMVAVVVVDVQRDASRKPPGGRASLRLKSAKRADSSTNAAREWTQAWLAECDARLAAAPGLDIRQ
jgi:hypothetical protein